MACALPVKSMVADTARDAMRERLIFETPTKIFGGSARYPSWKTLTAWTGPALKATSTRKASSLPHASDIPISASIASERHSRTRSPIFQCSVGEQGRRLGPCLGIHINLSPDNNLKCPDY